MAEGPKVLATGGGAFVQAETRALILDRGIAVWLDCDVATLVERVTRKDTRPLLRGGNPNATFVTVALNRVEFKKPVLVGDVVKFQTTLVKIGRTSVTMHIDVIAERGTETVHVTEAEAVLTGQPATAESFAKAAHAAAGHVRPSSDVHADGDYRRDLVRALTTRVLAAALALPRVQPLLRLRVTPGAGSKTPRDGPRGEAPGIDAHRSAADITLFAACCEAGLPLAGAAAAAHRAHHVVHRRHGLGLETGAGLA